MFEIRELSRIEDNLRDKYSKLSKIFLVIAILFLFLIATVALGIAFEMGPTWMLFTLEVWILAWCILIGFFIILELIFYFHFHSIRKKRLKREKMKPEFINGKRVYVYTTPKGFEGGIFSKTYVKIDEKSVLRLRALMIPPGELWGKKEE